MLAKYTTFSALVSIRLLIIEIFPTPVRGSLVGLTAMFGLLGSGLGYYYSVMVRRTNYYSTILLYYCITTTHVHSHSHLRYT